MHSKSYEISNAIVSNYDSMDSYDFVITIC